METVRLNGFARMSDQAYNVRLIHYRWWGGSCRWGKSLENLVRATNQTTAQLIGRAGFEMSASSFAASAWGMGKKSTNSRMRDRLHLGVRMDFPYIQPKRPWLHPCQRLRLCSRAQGAQHASMYSVARTSHEEVRSTDGASSRNGNTEQLRPAAARRAVTAPS